MQGSKTQLAISVPENVSQHKIIECLGVKPISNTVEGEIGVADFILNFFKDRGVDLWLVLYGSAG
jgi:hypothetical protein